MLSHPPKMYHVTFTRICNRGLFPHILAAYFAITWSAYFEKNVRVFLTCLTTSCSHDNDKCTNQWRCFPVLALCRQNQAHCYWWQLFVLRSPAVVSSLHSLTPRRRSVDQSAACTPQPSDIEKCSHIRDMQQQKLSYDQLRYATVIGQDTVTCSSA